jgi:WD40 repeat protein
MSAPSGVGHVFISYSHDASDRSYVEDLARHLDQAGVDTWFDRAISAGQEWERVIADRIDSCAGFVVVMTPAAGQSTWVAREIARAEQAGRPILPLLRDGEVFFRLATVQYEDIRGGLMPSSRFVQRLRELVLAPPPQWGGVWAMQTPDAGLTTRSDLIEPLVARLTGGPETVAVSTALHGAGGFGKTTLARQVCADPRVRARFHDGVWVTIGEDTLGAALAERVNDVSYQLTGARPGLADPDQAGLRLGALLDRHESVLLVIDDVWRPEQLRPFLHGGAATCTRLVTTRRPSTLPASTRQTALEVDQLTDGQARSLLIAGLPNVDGIGLAELVKLTGRWPLLVQLAHRYLARETRNDGAVDAVARLVRRLREGGPAVLNLRDETSRDRAVAASITASMDLLTPAEQGHFVELGIFAEDIDIPREALTLLWQITGDLDPSDVDQLCDLLDDLSLVADHTAARLRLHDVIRAYLRYRGRRELAATNAALVQAARRLLPEADAASGAWWRLPAAQDYLWRNLGQHLNDAGATAELAHLVTDLRWVEAKLRRYGPTSVDVDLGYAADDVAQSLRRALRRNAHLFEPGEPQQSLVDTLVSRLWGAPDLKAIVENYTATLSGVTRLVPRWPLPDEPHPSLQQVLTGHRRSVVACTIGPDGGWIATTSHDDTARIWDAATGALRQTLSGHTDELFSCAAAPNGLWLATTSRDRTGRIWEVRTGILRHTLVGHASPVTSCAVAPTSDWLVTTSHDSTARIWDAETGTVRAVLTGHTTWVTSCAIAADGRWLVTTSHDGTARIWTATGGAVRSVLTGHTREILACTIGPDASWLATASADGTARIWDPQTGALRHTLLGHTAPVTSCTAVGDRLATTSLDGTARLWDVRTGKPVWQLQHGDAVVSCAAPPDGSWLVTTSHDRTARIWDAAGGVLRHTLNGHTDSVIACALSPDGNRLATASHDRTARIWDTGTLHDRSSTVGHTDDVVTFGFVPGTAWGVSASRDGSARVWDIHTGALLTVLAGHTGAVLAVAAGPTGTVVTASLDLTARVWDLPAGTARHTLTGHTQEIVGCALAPDGTWLVTASRDGTARIWDTGAGVVRYVLSGHSDELLGCTIAPDGTWLLTFGRDDTARIWDISKGTLRYTFEHANEVRSAAIAPDGSWLLTTSSDRTARIWDAASGVLRHRLSGHPAAVGCGAIAPDGTWAATGGDDGMVRMWDAVHGDLRYALTGHQAAVTSCAASPDGRFLATTGADSTVRLWRANSGEAITAIRVTEPINMGVWHPHEAMLALAGRGGVYAVEVTGTTATNAG